MNITENEAYQNIMRRQTVREYLPDAVPDDIIDAVLAAAIRAPSGRNTQPCHIRTVENTAVLNEMNTDFKNLVGWNTPAYTNWDIHPFYHNAPVLFFIFAADTSETAAGLMAENIALACSALGLGSCMIGSIGALFDDTALSEKWKLRLDIPCEWKFLLAVSVGFPKELPPMKERESGHIKRFK